MKQVWSNGGGTQSAAIAALIVQGELPKPDLAVIADTGREASETWEYFEGIIGPALESVGVTMHVIPHSFHGDGYNTVDLYSGKDKDTVIMPMFTAQNGQGMLKKYCSNEWKSRPVQRFCSVRGIYEADLWIGFSTDEMERCRAYDDSQRWNHVYPLIDRRMNRGDCIALVERMGWGTPPRSACWMCPYRSDAEWAALSAPDLGRAINLEKRLQKRDPNVFFHRSCVPLAQVDFTAQDDLFAKPCASGMCFT